VFNTFKQLSNKWHWHLLERSHVRRGQSRLKSWQELATALLGGGLV
jgi:hypothetical protein